MPLFNCFGQNKTVKSDCPTLGMSEVSTASPFFNAEELLKKNWWGLGSNLWGTGVNLYTFLGGCRPPILIPAPQMVPQPPMFFLDLWIPATATPDWKRYTHYTEVSDRDAVPKFWCKVDASKIFQESSKSQKIFKDPPEILRDFHRWWKAPTSTWFTHYFLKHGSRQKLHQILTLASGGGGGWCNPPMSFSELHAKPFRVLCWNFL